MSITCNKALNKKGQTPTVTANGVDNQDSPIADGGPDEVENNSEDIGEDGKEEKEELDKEDFDERYSDEMNSDESNSDELNSDEIGAIACDSFGDIDDEEESIGPVETEVEQNEHSLSDQILTFKIFLAEDEGDGEEFTHWMQTIHVHCSYEGEVIGRGFGRYVRRDRIRASFWRDMEEPCQELSTIAFEIFDRYGRLRKDLKDHPVQHGTGVWGSELDLGSFFVIEYLLVDKEWRRKSIGTKIATYLIEKSQGNDRHPQVSLAAPGWLTHEVESEFRSKTKNEQREIKFRAHDDAVSFHRSLGFRRIGASNCFGLAANINHPARALMPNDDFDPAEEKPDLDEAPEEESDADWGVEESQKSWRLKLLKERLPLHYAAFTLPDSECVAFFKAWKTEKNSPEEWIKLDRYSNNIMHIAACEFKAQTVRWLFDDSGKGHILSLARNVKGYTPIEKLETDLETERTRRHQGMMTVDISESFSGYAPEAIGCLVALRRLSNPSQIQCAQLKFGCTCGKCIDGFLSPRMCFALLCQAEITHDLLTVFDEDGQMWLMMHHYLITYVAPDIQRNFATNKSYRRGFANLFLHAATALRSKNPPTLSNILMEFEDASEWPPYTRNFLQRGGRPESVLRTLFENTLEQDEWAGDGSHMETFEDQVKALPECRNDHEFGFVALACGLPNLTRLYG